MSEKDDLETIAKSLVAVQGTALACQLMLKALLVRIVIKEADPAAVLRKLFEQVSADLDRGQEALAGAQTTSISYARQTVEEIFLSFDQVLANRAAERKKRSDPM